MKRLIKLVTVADVKNFCNATTKVTGEVTITRGHYCVNGRSLMGLFSLDLAVPAEVEYHGVDEELFSELVKPYEVGEEE